MGIIITAGFSYVDIDVLACCVGYQELLEKLGIQSSVTLTAPFNATIPRAFATEKYHDLKPIDTNTKFILMDVSNPNYFEKFVQLENVIEVYDHHFGFESFWFEKIAEKAKIQKLGSCATLIWEAYKDHRLSYKISERSANLIYTAILSNTLNFKAKVTTDRDISAFEELKPFITLGDDWSEKYYAETTAQVMEDLENSIRTDTKHIVLDDGITHITQIEVWDSNSILGRAEEIEYLLNRTYKNECWIVSIVDISKGYNFFLSNSEFLLKKFSSFMTLTHQKPFYTNHELWLRKEILREIEGHS